MIGKKTMTMTKTYWIERNQTINVDWSAKTVVYCRNIFKHINIPKGNVVMLGAAYSLALEVLVGQFGKRAMGVDKWNFGNHPQCITEDIFELDDFDCAFVYCDVASFSHIAQQNPCPRLTAFEWSLRNLVPGGYCLTRMYGYSDQDMKSTQHLMRIVDKHNVTILPIPGNFRGSDWDSKDDVLLRKKG